MHRQELFMPDPKLEAPALLIIGEEDYVFKFPGIGDYIRSGEVKTFVPNLETVYLPEGTHFVQEQFPDQLKNDEWREFFAKSEAKKRLGTHRCFMLVTLSFSQTAKLYTSDPVKMCSRSLNTWASTALREKEWPDCERWTGEVGLPDVGFLVCCSECCPDLGGRSVSIFLLSVAGGVNSGFFVVLFLVVVWYSYVMSRRGASK